MRRRTRWPLCGASLGLAACLTAACAHAPEPLNETQSAVQQPTNVITVETDREPTLALLTVREGIPEGLSALPFKRSSVLVAAAAIEYFYGTEAYEPHVCYGLKLAFETLQSEQEIPFVLGMIATAYLDGLGLDRNLEMAYRYAHLAAKTSSELGTSYDSELQEFLGKVSTRLSASNLAKYDIGASTWSPSPDDARLIQWARCPKDVNRQRPR